MSMVLNALTTNIPESDDDLEDCSVEIPSPARDTDAALVLPADHSGALTSASVGAGAAVVTIRSESGVSLIHTPATGGLANQRLSQSGSSSTAGTPTSHRGDEDRHSPVVSLLGSPGNEAQSSTGSASAAITVPASAVAMDATVSSSSAAAAAAAAAVVHDVSTGQRPKRQRNTPTQLKDFVVPASRASPAPVSNSAGDGRRTPGTSSSSASRRSGRSAPAAVSAAVGGRGVLPQFTGALPAGALQTASASSTLTSSAAPAGVEFSPSLLALADTALSSHMQLSVTTSPLIMAAAAAGDHQDLLSGSAATATSSEDGSTSSSSPSDDGDGDSSADDREMRRHLQAQSRTDAAVSDMLMNSASASSYSVLPSSTGNTTSAHGNGSNGAERFTLTEAELLLASPAIQALQSMGHVPALRSQNGLSQPAVSAQGALNGSSLSANPLAASTPSAPNGVGRSGVFGHVVLKSSPASSTPGASSSTNNGSHKSPKSPALPGRLGGSATSPFSRMLPPVSSPAQLSMSPSMQHALHLQYGMSVPGLGLGAGAGANGGLSMSSPLIPGLRGYNSPATPAMSASHVTPMLLGLSSNVGPLGRSPAYPMSSSNYMQHHHQQQHRSPGVTATPRTLPSHMVSDNRRLSWSSLGSPALPALNGNYPAWSSPLRRLAGGGSSYHHSQQQLLLNRQSHYDAMSRNALTGSPTLNAGSCLTFMKKRKTVDTGMLNGQNTDHGDAIRPSGLDSANVKIERQRARSRRKLNHDHDPEMGSAHHSEDGSLEDDIDGDEEEGDSFSDSMSSSGDARGGADDEAGASGHTSSGATVNVLSVQACLQMEPSLLLTNVAAVLAGLQPRATLPSDQSSPAASPSSSTAALGTHMNGGVAVPVSSAAATAPGADPMRMEVSIQPMAICKPEPQHSPSGLAGRFSHLDSSVSQAWKYLAHRFTNQRQTVCADSTPDRARLYGVACSNVHPAGQRGACGMDMAPPAPPNGGGNGVMVKTEGANGQHYHHHSHHHHHHHQQQQPNGSPVSSSRESVPASSPAASPSASNGTVVGDGNHDLSAGALAPKAGNGSGSSCHQCKSRRHMVDLVFCCNMFSKRPGKGKRRVCRKKYCWQCLVKFYNEQPPEKRHDPASTWQCPACRGLCSCALCRRLRQPDGPNCSSMDSGPDVPLSLAFAVVYAAARQDYVPNDQKHFLDPLWRKWQQLPPEAARQVISLTDLADLA